MTQIEMVLLALLYEKEYYGYEMESIIEQRNMREWTKIGFSSIYNSLSKLEKKGFIASRFEKKYGSPKRKIYYIQEDAREFIREKLKEMLSSPEKVYSEFPIGMAFSHLLTWEEVVESLKKYRENLQSRRQRILSRYPEETMAETMPHLNALFTRPLKLIEAEIEWIDEFLEETNNKRREL